MRKIITSAVLVLVMVGAGILGCAEAPAAPPPAPPTLQPLEIEIIDIPVRYCSDDSTLLILNFKVHNPNSFLVAVENWNYYLSSPDIPHEPGDPAAWTELPRDSIFRTQYIPAGKDIEVSDKVLIVYKPLWIAQMMARALPPGQIMAEIAGPFWDKLAARSALLHVEGDVYITSEYGTLTQEYAFDYQGGGYQTTGKE